MSQKKRKEEKEIEAKDLNQLKVENEKMYEELTNKNSDYFFKLNRSLEEADLDEEDREDLLNQMMQEALEKQAEGITARRLYGTVTDQVDYILHGPADEEEKEVEAVELSPSWQLYVDGALLVGGVFAIVSAISEAMSKSGNSQLGLISMIANYLVGGLVMLAIAKTAPRPGQKNNYWKYFGASIGSIFVWAIFATLITIYVPTSINIPVPPLYSSIIGVLSLFAKWWFKKKHNVVGGIF